jgi:hypothetical protein
MFHATRYQIRKTHDRFLRDKRDVQERGAVFLRVRQSMNAARWVAVS